MSKETSLKTLGLDAAEVFYLFLMTWLWWFEHHGGYQFAITYLDRWKNVTFIMQGGQNVRDCHPHFLTKLIPSEHIPGE